MDIEDVIFQLINLQCHCEEMRDSVEGDSEWTKDVKALEYAIKRLRGDIDKWQITII